MQSWALINNSLIKSIDKESEIRTLPKPLSNSLKTLVKISTSQTFSSGSIYAKRLEFDIPRQYDNLAQLYIKCYLSITAATSTVEPYLATKIFKEINFKTKRGTVLQRIVPAYSKARVDEYTDTEIYTHLNAGINGDVAFTAGTTVTCIVPLFLFFSEDQAMFLKTRMLEQLSIELLVNDDKGSMGMQEDLTSASYEVYALYHDLNDSNKYSDLYWTKKSSVPKVLKGSFNIFTEDDLTCASGSTSARLLLRCNHPAYVLHCSLTNSSSQQAQIKTIKLIVANNTLIDIDYRMNYQMYATTKSFVESGVFSLYFNKLKHRNVDSGLITFSKSMFPCYLDITYDSLGSDYTLKVIEEYRTHFMVDDIGQISLSSDVSIDTLVEGLDQINSSTAALRATGM